MPWQGSRSLRDCPAVGVACVGCDVRQRRIASLRLMRRRLVDSLLHFEWSGHTGPGNLGNAPKVPPRRSADMRPDPSRQPGVPAARDAHDRSNDARTRGGRDGNEPLPVTGAWRTGRPVGHRQFLTFATDRPFALDGGVTLRDVTVAYETWGTLDDDASQRDPAVPRVDRRQPRRRPGRATVTQRRAGGTAWSGPGLAIDTDRWFVVCANVLGGCQGSTGPASPHPDRRPARTAAGSRSITIRDMVRAQARLADTSAIAVVARGHRRLDGRDAGARVGDHLSRTACARSCRSPRACRRRRSRSRGVRSAGGRSASTRSWRGGDYYDAEPGDGPCGGAGDRPHGRPGHVPQRQRVHRSVRPRARRRRRRSATRSTCGSGSRSSATSTTTATSWSAGSTPTATSIIGKAMDLHDVARGRGGLEAAMARIRVPTLTIGISSDMLYPTYQQRQMSRTAVGTAGRGSRC